MTRYLALVILLSVLSLSACGGGGGGSPAPNPPPDPPANVSPTISSISDLSVNEGEILSITASASDADGTIASYAWTQSGVIAVSLENQSTATVILTAPAVDTDAVITLSVTATDNDGASVSTSVQITIVAIPFSASPHRVNFFNDQDLSGFFTFFDHKNINRIDVVITQAEWDAFMLELETDLDSDVYFETEVTITTASGSETIPQTGLRIRGNTTRQVPQQDGVFVPVHFKLKFNETFELEEETLPFLERKERRFANLRALNLKNRRPGFDDSQIRELYAYDLFNQVGMKAPLTGSVHLFITIGENTIDYGIYTAIEPIDKTFLRKRYGDDDNEGNLYKCLWKAGGPATLSLKHPDVSTANWIGVSETLGFDPSYDLKTNKSIADHTVLTNFITQLNALDGTALETYLNANFEVDGFLKYMAMNMLIGNSDDYWAFGNNYYLYFNNNGKIEFITYDYDKGFGGGSTVPTETANIYDWFNRSGPLSGDSFYDDHPLVDKMLDIDSFLSQYDNYLTMFIDTESGNFNHAAYTVKFEQLKALYDPDGDGQLESDIADNVSGMNNDEQEYFETKINSVRNQLEM